MYTKEHINDLYLDIELLRAEIDGQNFVINVLRKKIKSYESEIKELKSKLDIKQETDAIRLKTGIDKTQLDILKTSITQFELSTRAMNILIMLKCRTLGDAAMLSEHKILRSRTCGLKTLDEIKNLLKTHGLHLGMNFDDVVLDYINSKDCK